MNNIPETTNYMILGFTVIFTPMVIYLISLGSRLKKAKAEIKFLELEE